MHSTKISTDMRRGETHHSAPSNGGATPLSRAELIFHVRRERDKLFGGSGFALKDPAWDLLLELYIANKRDRSASVTSVCYGACIPAATGIRHLRRLGKAGLVSFRRDPQDGRREFVRLTERAIAALDGLFAL